ncbi:MAG TPA: hypothetical protein PLV12_05410, partial [Saprospiraceae bacterium]|nr:hypothetical protein [Saprospiraceae bacterium]
MGDFKIKLVSTLDTEPSYAGYKLVATYRQRIFDSYVSGKHEVEINAEGEGILVLPPVDVVENDDIFIDIFAYNGYSVFERETYKVDTFYESSDDKFVFNVTPASINNFSESKTAYKISGKLIDLEKECQLNGLTLAIYGGKKA